jgi:hypothetical protein
VGDVKIEGVKEEAAIVAFNKNYLLKGSAYHAYLIKLINELDLENDKSLFWIFRRILDIGNEFLHYNKIFITEEDMERVFEYLFSDSLKRTNRDLELFWKVIKREELIKALFITKWKSFDIYFWNRKYHSFML